MSAITIADAASRMGHWNADGACAPQHLVDLLHGRSQFGLAGAQAAWAAINGGHLRHTFQGIGGTHETANFAGLCDVLGRLDVLRAVIEAGQPGWLHDPDLTKASSWMRELSTTYSPFGANHKGLSYLAARYPITGVRDAVSLVAEFDPEHPAVHLLADTFPAVRAIFVEARMAMAIRQAGQASDQALAQRTAGHEVSEAPPRRRLRL